MVVKNNTRPIHLGTIPILLLAVGLIFIGSNFLHDLGSHLRIVGLKIKEPTSFNFTSYNQLLNKYVDHGLVDYESLKHDPLLASCTDELASVSPNKLKNKLDELAYWLNAYNFLSMKNIADHYPLKNYKELGHSPSSRKFIVGGKIHSLAEIEETQLRPLIEKTDWRAIFLTCDGCTGSPELASHAYQSSTIDKDMQTACAKFVSNPNNYFFNSQNHVFSISPFYLENEHLIKSKYRSAADLICQELGEEHSKALRSAEWNFALPFDYRINDSKLASQRHIGQTHNPPVQKQPAQEKQSSTKEAGKE